MTQYHFLRVGEREIKEIVLRSLTFGEVVRSRCHGHRSLDVALSVFSLVSSGRHVVPTWEGVLELRSGEVVFSNSLYS